MSTLELVFTPDGSAELISKRGNIVRWSSAADDDFRDRNHNELLGEADADSVLDYLVGIGKLTEAQADDIEIFEESEDGDDDPDDGEPLEGEIV